MGDLSLDEISNRIVKAVVSEPFINEESLSIRIRPILEIWIKQTDKFRKGKATKPKLQQTIEEEKQEKLFWKEKLKLVVGSENMTSYYEESKKLFSN